MPRTDRIRGTSAWSTHRAKRVRRGLVLGLGALFLIMQVVSLAASRPTGTTGSGSALPTAAPLAGTAEDKAAWYQAVITNPSLLGKHAPTVSEPVSDPVGHNERRASEGLAVTEGGEDKESGSTAPPTAVASASASPGSTAPAGAGLSQEARGRIENVAEPAASQTASQLAPLWVTYSYEQSPGEWVDSLGRIGDGLRSSALAGAGQEWGEISSQQVVSTGRVVAGRAPSVWVSDDMKRARVTVLVERSASAGGGTARTDYQRVTVSLDGDGGGESWTPASVSTQ